MCKKKRKKKVKTSITFFVCLGLKRAEKNFGGYKKIQKKIKKKIKKLYVNDGVI